MRAVPVQHTDDITSFLEFRTSHKLLDSYIEQYELDEDEPVMMTNSTQVQNGNVTHSRIDRAYYSQPLHGKIRFDDPDLIPHAAVSTQGHIPIAITILDPAIAKVHQYKKIWRMNIDSTNDTVLRKKLTNIIQSSMVYKTYKTFYDINNHYI